MDPSDFKGISRRFSLCAVMQTITNCGPISRASIARQTGLSKQTISEIVRRLDDGGWVRETGRTRGHVGRTAVTYELVPDAAHIASVDLGGTKVRVAIADLGCAIIGEAAEPTHPDGGSAVVGQIARLCREVAFANGVDMGKVMVAVVGVPGVPEPAGGRILMAPNIRGIGDFDFVGRLERELGVGVLIENDVNLAVQGEHWVGCGAEADDLVLISLGTGVGAGLIIEGNLVRGARGSAGEVGYLPFGADPFEPESLRMGAFERKVSSEGIRRRYAELSGQARDVPGIFDAMALGDRAARQVMEETAMLLARLIATLGVVVNPSLVVMGGNIGRRQELIDLVIPALERCCPCPVQLERSVLGDHAALAGGAALGLTHLHAMLFAEGLAGVQLVLPRPAAYRAGGTGG